MIEVAQVWEYVVRGTYPKGAPQTEIEGWVRACVSWNDGMRGYIRESVFTLKSVLVLNSDPQWRLEVRGIAPVGMDDKLVEPWLRSGVNWNDTMLTHLKQTIVTVGQRPLVGPQGA